MKINRFIIATGIFLVGISSVSAESKNIISLTGTGNATAEPNRVSVSVGVEIQEPDAVKAINDNNAKMQEMINNIKASGIKDKNMQTSNFSIWPQYSYKTSKIKIKNENEEITYNESKVFAYRVNNNLTITLEDVSKLGDVLGKVAGAGANKIHSINFDVDAATKKQLLDKARTNAILDAKHRAELYAKAAGIKLGKIMNINEINNHYNIMYKNSERIMAFEDSDSSPVPVAAGQQEISVSVNITWELIED